MLSCMYVCFSLISLITCTGNNEVNFVIIQIYEQIAFSYPTKLVLGRYVSSRVSNIFVLYFHIINFIINKMKDLLEKNKN
jgi:hypothetical protein